MEGPRKCHFWQYEVCLFPLSLPFVTPVSVYPTFGKQFTSNTCYFKTFAHTEVIHFTWDIEVH